MTDIFNTVQLGAYGEIRPGSIPGVRVAYYHNVLASREMILHRGLCSDECRFANDQGGRDEQNLDLRSMTQRSRPTVGLTSSALEHLHCFQRGHSDANEPYTRSSHG